MSKFWGGLSFLSQTTSEYVHRGVDFVTGDNLWSIEKSKAKPWFPDGAVAIVTGSNTGLGKATAIYLAKLGCHVILACRSESKGLSAVNDVKNASKSNNVEYMNLDLSSNDSVSSFAKSFLARKKPLHLLVNNAGMMPTGVEHTADGVEMNLQVNHVGHFLLTALLLPSLQAAKPAARVVSVASVAHNLGHFDFADLAMTRGKFAEFDVYGRSKLANVLFAKELERRLAASPATSHISSLSLNPGYVRTEFYRTGSISMNVMGLAAHLAAKRPETGARTQILACVAPPGALPGGSYLADTRVAAASAEACDAGVAERLWRETEVIVKKWLPNGALAAPKK